MRHLFGLLALELNLEFCLLHWFVNSLYGISKVYLNFSKYDSLASLNPFSLSIRAISIPLSVWILANSVTLSFFPFFRLKLFLIPFFCSCYHSASRCCLTKPWKASPVYTNRAMILNVIDHRCSLMIKHNKFTKKLVNYFNLTNTLVNFYTRGILLSVTNMLTWRFGTCHDEPKVSTHDNQITVHQKYNSGVKINSLYFR